MKQTQRNKIVHTNVPVTNKRWCSLGSALLVSAFAMVANLPAQVNDAAFVTKAEEFGMTSSVTDYDFGQLESGLPTHFSQMSTYSDNGKFLVDTAEMKGTGGGTVHSEAGWTISMNFKLDHDASHTKHMLFGGMLYYVSATQAPTDGIMTYWSKPHNFFVEYNTTAEKFQIKSQVIGQGTNVFDNNALFDAGENVNLTVVRNIGGGTFTLYINGERVNKSQDENVAAQGTALSLGTNGYNLIKRDATDASDYFDSSLAKSFTHDENVALDDALADTDFRQADELSLTQNNGHTTVIRELSFANQMMIGIGINRDNLNDMAYFDGEITSVATWDRSLNESQIAELNAARFSVPQLEQTSLILGAILMGYFLTRRRNAA